MMAELQSWQEQMPTWPLQVTFAPTKGGYDLATSLMCCTSWQCTDVFTRFAACLIVILAGNVRRLKHCVCH